MQTLRCLAAYYVEDQPRARRKIGPIPSSGGAENALKLAGATPYISAAWVAVMPYLCHADLGDVRGRYDGLAILPTNAYKVEIR